MECSYKPRVMLRAAGRGLAALVLTVAFVSMGFAAMQAPSGAHLATGLFHLSTPKPVGPGNGGP